MFRAPHGCPDERLLVSLCSSVTPLFLLPTPHGRHKRLLGHWSRVQQGAQLDVLCSGGPPEVHRVALQILEMAHTTGQTETLGLNVSARLEG